MRRGEIWFAATPGGDRPVLIITRDPVADRIGSLVVAALTRTQRGLVSELELTPSEDGVPSGCLVNFDNLHTLPRAGRSVAASPRSPRRVWLRHAGRCATRLAAERRRDPSCSQLSRRADQAVSKRLE
jgi:mRNA interferase MazF